MLNPKHVNIGKDVSNINYFKDYIYKFFKKKIYFDQTLDFYNKYDFYFVPKLIAYDNKKNMIKQSYVGNMMSLYDNLPNDWIIQMNNIRKEFIKNNIIIQDLRFLPYTPIVVNNFTVMNNKIYIVDLTMTISCNKKYIDYKFDNLIFQIKMNLFMLKYFNKYLLIIPHIFYHLMVLIFDW